jgi:hypothetical protein
MITRVCRHRRRTPASQRSAAVQRHELRRHRHGLTPGNYLVMRLRYQRRPSARRSRPMNWAQQPADPSC